MEFLLQDIAVLLSEISDCKYDKNHITMDYGCYNKDIWKYNKVNGCNLNLRLLTVLDMAKG